MIAVDIRHFLGRGNRTAPVRVDGSGPFVVTGFGLEAAGHRLRAVMSPLEVVAWMSSSAVPSF
ncbi:hypothetical protein ABZ912_55680, partial [Nonomuraea angiospora]|uniref:hypothetical protein n=1 Tax=Nonomuraea angiospora TaxID=46172 RepID=UPI0033D28196